ncbi:MAG TPA: LCP family protein, partial [Candidatus Kapabacteria bacterium]|nr:LCP family protein [Candidatus Kapabacteria bacterium]
MPEEIQQKKSNTKRVVLVILAILLLGMGGWMVLAHVAPTQVASPVAVVKKTTDNIYYAVKEDDLKKAAAQLPPHINILITGLDNRLGQNDNHADAVHLFTIFPDKGTIEITSVPRDTKCFIDSTFPDSLSHFSNARSKLGRKGYIHTAEMFLNKGKMDYWVELNFSTVMGILQLIGYKDPATALQFLRHRKSFSIGDVQRSHNQAVFMKQAIVKYFNLMTGMSGDFLLTAGLGMIETNLTKEACEGLIYKLKQKGFPNNPDAITLKMEPPPPGKFEDITINPDN